MSKESIAFKHREDLYNDLKNFSSRPKWMNEYIPEITKLRKSKSDPTLEMIKLMEAQPKMQKVIDLINLGYLKNITRELRDSVDERDEEQKVEIAELLVEHADKGELMQITSEGWEFISSFEDELRQRELIEFEKSNAKKIRLLTFLLFLAAIVPAFYYIMKIVNYLFGVSTSL